MMTDAKTHSSPSQAVFVVGLNRSGTKWLSNELSAHPQIACVLSEKTGIRETNLFRCFGRKFDLEKFDDFVGMVELWSATDFFERSGISTDQIYRLEPLPTDNYELFAAMMNLYAEKENKRYWLQKAPPLAGLELYAHFPQANFVAIRRDLHDQVNSHIKLLDDRSWWSLTRAAFAFVRDSRILDKFCRRAKCPVVQYTEFAGNKEAVLDRLLAEWKMGEFPGLAGRTRELIANSSFDSSVAREQFLAPRQKLWISVCASVFRWIPYFVMIWLARRAWSRPGSLIPGTFDNIHRRWPGLRDKFHASVQAQRRSRRNGRRPQAQ